MIFFPIFISVIIQFGVSTVNDKDPKTSAPSSTELDDYSLVVGSFFVMEKEIWKDIKGWKQFYQISSRGRVKSLGRYIQYTGKTPHCQWHAERILKQDITRGTKQEYFSTYLCKNDVKKAMLVHCLIAEAFIPNPNKFPFVNHKNGITTDNRIENLEWVNKRENNTHGWQSRHKSSKFTGVCWVEDKKKWKARIEVDGMQIHLGYSDSEENISDLYTAALKKYRVTNRYAV